MGKSSKSTIPDPTIPTILVTGDVVVDHHLYIGEQRSATAIDSTKRHTFEYVEFGGAAMIERLLRLPPGSEDPAWNVHFGLVKDQACFAHCFATWQPCPEPDPDGKVPSFWLAREAGYGAHCTVIREETPAPKAAADPDGPDCAEDGAKHTAGVVGCPAKAADPAGKVQVVVVDDAGAGFRDRAECWPTCLNGQAEAPTWMVWKMAGDLTGGELWEQVKATLSVDSSLILVVSAADLRRAGLEVTVGLSWERAALDVLKGLETTVLEPLKTCAHLIVSFPDAGALWINRPGEDEPRQGKKPDTAVRLIYDPAGGGGVPIGDTRPKAFGYQACLVSGVAWSVATAGPGQKPDLSDGLRRGLMARNKLYREGHGELKSTPSPAGFPAEAIQKAALAPEPHLSHELKLANTRFPLNAPATWTIAQHGMMAPGPFFDTAYTVARNGLTALPAVPRLAMGGYVTIERDEIEAMRRLSRQVFAYANGGPQKRPLSIAVFGAPGAGKSYIVKQMAAGLLDHELPVVECNLSQISEERDLQGAFHLVRDEVLKGKMPVVFWDEFDSQEYRWLRLLLAPMQDGVFREAQTVHPIGKCVFVFAGATSATFEEFGTPDGGAGAVDAANQKRAWKMAKGPDFKSRIHGHLDVLGPNPRLKSVGSAAPVVDRSDACFPIRRALFLRGVWKLGREKKTDRLFDERLARALLEVPEYTNGSRSFERVLAELARGTAPIGPEALPSAEDLGRDISSTAAVRQFLISARGVARGGVVREQLRVAIEARIDELAARINQVYMKNPKAVPNADVTFAYDNLSLFLRESNRAAVRRIPRILDAAGLEIVLRGTPRAVSLKEAQRLLELRIDVAAAAEHEAWREFHEKRGWKPTTVPGAKKDIHSDPPLHPLLIDWDAMVKEEDRDRDRHQVRCYVEIVYDEYRGTDAPALDPELRFALAPVVAAVTK